jgi:hypothetical protein
LTQATLDLRREKGTASGCRIRLEFGAVPVLN